MKAKNWDPADPMPNWAARRHHELTVRAERRGWPPLEVRPICLQCDKPLQPVFDYVKFDAANPRISSETDVLVGWMGKGNVFHSGECAIRWALKQPFVKAARLNNEALVERLDNAREEQRRKR